ncbi:hypothetical protein KPL74_17415 [Bacillus sp. NP157]|nr:hypothetical protein KPL74_17415 [Bacillus sp. NP157]
MNYIRKPVRIGRRTDPYRPVEKQWRFTRGALAPLNECKHKFTNVTKNTLSERALGILAPMAERNVVLVFADVIRKQVQMATRTAELHKAWDTVLDTSRFVAPRIVSPQGELF